MTAHLAARANVVSLCWRTLRQQYGHCHRLVQGVYSLSSSISETRSQCHKLSSCPDAEALGWHQFSEVSTQQEQHVVVCVGCLFLRTPSRAPYRTPSACANRAAVAGGGWCVCVCACVCVCMSVFLYTIYVRVALSVDKKRERKGRLAPQSTMLDLKLIQSYFFSKKKR